ncbi:unnamed protein product [Hermetia illucens]|uniref:Uncharacterized protein n=1 Tax=Hermetia illucens TaxID=343691 RepID=A0A7R8UG14_HERIL|nr:unnamed protein product [Hermetia illucens]
MCSRVEEKLKNGKGRKSMAVLPVTRFDCNAKRKVAARTFKAVVLALGLQSMLANPNAPPNNSIGSHHSTVYKSDLNASQDFPENP